MRTLRMFLVLSSISFTLSTISIANKEICKLVARGHIYALSNYVDAHQIGYDEFVAPDENGRTPEQIAEKSGHSDMIQMVNDIEIELRDRNPDLGPAPLQFRFDEEEFNTENANPNFFRAFASPRSLN